MWKVNGRADDGRSVVTIAHLTLWWAKNWQLKDLILTVWFNFQTYIIFSINLVSQVILRSSGTEILYGCHLLGCLYNILYFLCLWLYNEFFIILYNILKIAELRLLSNYNIKYICTIYTRLDTCLMSISRFSLRDKVTLRLLKLYFYIADVVEGTGHKAKRLVLQCINGASSNPIEGRPKIWQLKDLILTLFGLIFRRI
jgi:hypothetical protein